MLYIVEEYEFNSAACFEAIEVLDIIKTAFDDVDIENLKEYVKKNLADSKTTHFMFESGRHTNHANLATIVKIGIALKRLLSAASAQQVELVKEDSYDFHMLDEDEKPKKGAVAEASSQSSTKSYSHLNDSHWRHFCEGRLRHYETKWTKKLEDYTDEDNKEIVSDNDEYDQVNIEEGKDETEDQLKHFDADAIETGGARSLSKSQTFDSKSGKYIDVTEDDRKNSKDDWGVNAPGNTEFASNNYWKVDEAYSIDDLLKDAEGF
jgi:hypothetical protein